MKAFACVYRNFNPPRTARSRTQQAAESDPRLRRFLEQYDEPDCFYDWGDDPSFFLAQEILGDVRRASWGVCRAPIRGTLGHDDFVAFFCAKQSRSQKSRWDYYYVGVGTIAEAVDRRQAQTQGSLGDYEAFYNILVRSEGRHHETFHPYHEDWERRAAAPYIIFSSHSNRTKFELSAPLHVAMYSGGDGETWFSDRSRRTAALHSLLFEERRVVGRTLRSRNPYIAHPPLNLATGPGGRCRPGRDLLNLREALLKI
jgi:hypothetical protein